jgi:tRNA threonylcarbamoyladenosine biosynthesis protein TsaB
MTMPQLWPSLRQEDESLLVLGIDTATLVCSTAVVSEEKLVAEYTLQVKKTHSERLLPFIAAMLKDAGIDLGSLDGVAVAAGPGSFTGLRIGIVTARALGQALEVPLCGVSTLEALAAQHPLFNGIICPILDARRNQVYNALFQGGRKCRRLTEDRAISLARLLAELGKRQEDVLFIGDAVPVYQETVADALGPRACFMPQESAICRSGAVARLGLAKIAAGRGCTWRELKPNYIRRSQAEIKLQAQAAGGD